jgi:hypothetical protein
MLKDVTLKIMPYSLRISEYISEHVVPSDPRGLLMRAIANEDL